MGCDFVIIYFFKTKPLILLVLYNKKLNFYSNTHYRFFKNKYLK